MRQSERDDIEKKNKGMSGVGPPARHKSQKVKYTISYNNKNKQQIKNLTEVV